MTSETWDNIQDTIMIAGALGLWGGFEVLCFMNESFAALGHVNTTRTALITICTNLFTFRFTKSQTSASTGGGKANNG